MLKKTRNKNSSPLDGMHSAFKMRKITNYDIANTVNIKVECLILYHQGIHTTRKC